MFIKSIMILVNQKIAKLTDFFISQAEIKTTTQFGFEIQLSRIYTRAVFADFKQTHYRSTAFRSEQSTDNPTKYLVRHYNQSDDFDWARHEFQVVVDVTNGIYECECKMSTHTGQWDNENVHKKDNNEVHNSSGETNMKTKNKLSEVH